MYYSSGQEVLRKPTLYIPDNTLSKNRWFIYISYIQYSWHSHSWRSVVTWHSVYKHWVTLAVDLLRDPSGKNRCTPVPMATDKERLANFELAFYDQYEYYNLDEYPCHAGGKGRTKREIELNTNRHSPSGHERKIAEKFHNSELKRRRTKTSTWKCLSYLIPVRVCLFILMVMVILQVVIVYGQLHVLIVDCKQWLTLNFCDVNIGVNVTTGSTYKIEDGKFRSFSAY